MLFLVFLFYGAFFLTSRALAASNGMEHFFVEVKFNGNVHIISTAFLPPRSSFIKYPEFCDNLDKLSDEFPDSKLCVVGDFTIPNAQWSSGDVASVASLVQLALSNEVESIQVVGFYHNLYQVNSIRNANNVLLEMVFWDDEKVMFSCR